jgi:hypothetical protein
MSLVAQAVVISLLLLFATGCSDDRVRTLTVPSGVTRINVQTGDGRVLKQIDSSTDIQRVLEFLASRPRHWEYSDSGFPTPPLEIFFYHAEERLGRFGASCNGGIWFFESDLASKDRFTLYGIRASDEDVRAFIALIGMADYPLKTEGCS